MSEYTEILPDGTRKVVKYQRGIGPVSRLIKMEKRLEWLKKHEHLWTVKTKGELKHLNRQIEHSRRKLKTHRQHVAQSKSSPRSASTKGRVETNIRTDNLNGLAACGGDVGATGNGHAFTQSTTAALSLPTGCELTPQGCSNRGRGQTAVKSKDLE